ncbi:DJ-1/PfpI family protein [Streptomyces sp. LX-29]|uniref:DJ-1/PfpI family protein n=1 Tax=Streptomyces sp. LX-29 TaxID=2900152 RepID=UPI00240E7E3A|nr:DJ-1/PfpI family protein [Streptomyces sp. LX-29]WFB08661.1 DJ-1/PfpI family protein [Streptomyces sp. LX-29]
MGQQTVHVAVYDALADWEVGFATAHIRETSYHRPPRAGFAIATVGLSGEPVVTMGGMRIQPDLTVDALRPQDSALLILPGASTWDTGDTNAPFARAARAFLDADVPVAAICGATAGLAREGLLDDRDHTSGAAGYLAATGYQGGDRYREAAAVTDGNLVTAGPTEPVAFAREVLALLDVYEPEVLDAWYRLFSASDASAFGVLAEAAQR